MTSDDLTIEQAEFLRGQVASSPRFLGRLTERMDELSFPPGDTLKVAAERARKAMADLHIDLRYRTCASGVGGARTPSESPPVPSPI